MAWQRLCFQNPSRVYSFGNPLRTFWQSFASRVLKNLARFFLLRRNFLPYIRGDSGNLLGFWPSGPKPCWGKNFISQVIDCQCEPFEILLNPKFNFRMNNSVFYGGSKFCPPFNWNPSVSAITLILLVSPNFKKLKSGFLSLIFCTLVTPGNEWVNNIPYLSHSWRFYHQFSKDNATIKCRYLSGI